MICYQLIIWTRFYISQSLSLRVKIKILYFYFIFYLFILNYSFFTFWLGYETYNLWTYDYYRSCFKTELWFRLKFSWFSLIGDLCWQIRIDFFCIFQAKLQELRETLEKNNIRVAEAKRGEVLQLVVGYRAFFINSKSFLEFTRTFLQAFGEKGNILRYFIDFFWIFIILFR